MKVLVTGSRNWRDGDTIRDALSILWSWGYTELIHGAQTSYDKVEKTFYGADYLCAVAAREMGYRIQAFPADWDRLGRSAGPRRNEEMLAQGPDLVVYFHRNIKDSRGTKHMVNIARSAKVKTLDGDTVAYFERFQQERFA